MNDKKNPEKIKNMFDEISSYYDRMNNLISFGLHKIIKIKVLKELNIKSKSMILDICCGTGDFTQIIAKLQPKSYIIGLDISEKMLKIAKKKNPNKTFMVGDVTSLPFKNEEFDYITVGFGLRNIQDRQKALNEIYRTLKNGGKFLHLDFGMHNKISKVFDYIVPFIAKIEKVNFNSYEYLADSKKTFPEPLELISEFNEHGFKTVKKIDFLFGAISAQIMTK